MAHDVFISYSNKDKPIADAICTNLEVAGIRCWIAPRDIAPGEDWPTAIAQAIPGCLVMVLVFSENSNRSKQVGREISLAADNDLVIIPFRIENVQPEPGKNYYLDRTHWLDAMNPPTKAQIKTLVGYVRSFISAKATIEIAQPAPEDKLPVVETVRPPVTPGRKKLWLLGIPIVLAVVGGGIYGILSIGKGAKPASSTVTPASMPPQAAILPTVALTSTPTRTSVPPTATFTFLPTNMFTTQPTTMNTGESKAWTSIGLEGKFIQTLAIDPETPTTLYAGTDAGVYKSTDGGGTWSEVNNGLNANPSISALAIDPSTPANLYAVTYQHGVFKSTDGGGNWSAVNTGLPSTSVEELAIDPATPSTLYVGLGFGVFKSTNGGGNWSAVNTGLTTPSYIPILVIDPATPTNIYAVINNVVFKSTNGGGNWSAVNTGLNSTAVYALAIDPATPSNIYAATNIGVFKSTNGGGNWSAVNTGLPGTSLSSLVIDPATPSTLYVGGSTWGQSIFKSTDGGGNWSAVNILIRGAVYALSIDPAMPSTLYVGTNDGAYVIHQIE